MLGAWLDMLWQIEDATDSIVAMVMLFLLQSSNFLERHPLTLELMPNFLTSKTELPMTTRNISSVKPRTILDYHLRQSRERLALVLISMLLTLMESIDEWKPEAMQKHMNKIEKNTIMNKVTKKGTICTEC
jgi:hypothetical protein